MNFMDSPEFKVLFLCMGNSARRIFAECILNNIGTGHFIAYSAGSAPKSHVHPLALRVLKIQEHIDAIGASQPAEVDA